MYLAGSPGAKEKEREFEKLDQGRVIQEDGSGWGREH